MQKAVDEKAEILLVGSHALLTDSLAARLRRGARLAVVGVARSPALAAGLMRERPADILLLDIDMAGVACFQLAAAVKTGWPSTRIVFISASARDQTIDRVLRIGASGFLLKRDLSETLLPAIDEVLAGGAWFPESVAPRILVDASGTRLVETKPLTIHDRAAR